MVTAVFLKTPKDPEAVEVDAHQSDVHTQLVEAREQLVAKDEELQQLRAQLGQRFLTQVLETLLERPFSADRLRIPSS